MVLACRTVCGRAQGNLTDETTRDFIRQQLEALVAWTRRLERGKEET